MAKVSVLALIEALGWLLSGSLNACQSFYLSVFPSVCLPSICHCCVYLSVRLLASLSQPVSFMKIPQEISPHEFREIVHTEEKQTQEAKRVSNLSSLVSVVGFCVGGFHVGFFVARFRQLLVEGLVLLVRVERTRSDLGSGSDDPSFNF